MRKKVQNRIQKVGNFHKKHTILSDWECNFVVSLLNYIEKHDSLSPRQMEIFQKIERKCTVDAVKSMTAWHESYDEEKKNIAKVCAKYYSISGYFSALSSRVLSDPEFIPTERQYKKMCENKYALKLMAAISSEPKYAVGSMVMLRTPAARNYKRRPLKGVPCLVLSTLDYVVNAVKGAKQYRILPYGQTSPCVLEERQLRKWKATTKKKSKKADTCEDIPF